jgi:hypothetical protein
MEISASVENTKILILLSLASQLYAVNARMEKAITMESLLQHPRTASHPPSSISFLTKGEMHTRKPEKKQTKICEELVQKRRYA